MSVTRNQILEIAEDLVQKRGFNAFSFRDLSARIGIKAPSIHHHFATKNELCLALIVRHRGILADALARIDASPSDPSQKLRKYVKIFREALSHGSKMCLCGMMASDVETLPAEAREELKRLVGDHETWLAAVIEEGRSRGVLRFSGSPALRAMTLFASLEGILLITRMDDDPTRFNAMARTLMAGLLVEP